MIEAAPQYAVADKNSDTFSIIIDGKVVAARLSADILPDLILSLEFAAGALSCSGWMYQQQAPSTNTKQ